MERMPKGICTLEFRAEAVKLVELEKLSRNLLLLSPLSSTHADAELR